MMDQTVSKLLNEQINKEFYSAYLYLDIANFYDDKGLDGFANWYEIQAKEEMDHAMLFYHYLHNNDEPVTLLAIDKPDKTFSTLMEPLEAALAHEKYVTSLINNIYAAAQKANDFRTTQFLDWFIKEQGEEEKTPVIRSPKCVSMATTPEAFICSTASCSAAPMPPLP